MRPLLIPGFLALLVTSQQPGTVVHEVHPKLAWKRCSNGSTGASCEAVNGAVVIDADWRWLHIPDGFRDCYLGGDWVDSVCNSTESCTKCNVEGADYKELHGITTDGSKLSQQLVTYSAFGASTNSRVYLMDETRERYQTFTLMGNELAFDVELSSVDCAINSALYFVAMDADGGLEKYPTSKAGAKYGTGYCDASCPRSNRFVGGKANYEDWTRTGNDPTRGEGRYGACCSEFDVWNSNRRAFSMISKPCINTGYKICEYSDCDNNDGLSIGSPICDSIGCDYNPFRLGNKDFYGKGKTVDTDKKITVVTRFEEDKVTQFFVQDGKKIEAPAPTYSGFPEQSGISANHCRVLKHTFGEPDTFNRVGGYSKHNDALRRPMVLAMSISNDYWANNLWLDSVYPVDAAGLPGAERGPCPSQPNSHTPVINPPRDKVAWSNIRFGPIGTTV